MATLVNRRLLWIENGHTAPCIVVAHDLAAARCEILVGACRYWVSAYDLHNPEPSSYETGPSGWGENPKPL